MVACLECLFYCEIQLYNCNWVQLSSIVTWNIEWVFLKSFNKTDYQIKISIIIQDNCFWKIKSKTLFQSQQIHLKTDKKIIINTKKKKTKLHTKHYDDFHWKLLVSLKLPTIDLDYLHASVIIIIHASWSQTLFGLMIACPWAGPSTPSCFMIVFIIDVAWMSARIVILGFL